MNKICRRFEQEFDGYISKHNSKIKFDYTIMKNDSAEYTTTQFKAIKKLYEDYNKRMQSYTIFAQNERVDKYDAFTELSEMNAEYHVTSYVRMNRHCATSYWICAIRKVHQNDLPGTCAVQKSYIIFY